MIKYNVIDIHRRKISYLTAVEKNDDFALGYVDMNFWPVRKEYQEEMIVKVMEMDDIKER